MRSETIEVQGGQVRFWRGGRGAPLILLQGGMADAALHWSPIWDALAEQFDVHPNQITSWKAQLEGGAADVFGPVGGNGAAQPAVDVKSLHAKIGELTLENDS